MIIEAADFGYAGRIRRARLLYEHGEARAARDVVADMPGRQPRLIDAACALDLGDARAAAASRDEAMRSEPGADDEVAGALECAFIDMRLAIARHDVETAQHRFANVMEAFEGRPPGRFSVALAMDSTLRLAQTLIDFGRIADAARVLERAERIVRRLPSCPAPLMARFALVRAEHAIQSRTAADVTGSLRQVLNAAVDAQAPFAATAAAVSLANYYLQLNDHAGVIAHTGIVFALATTRADPSCLYAACVRAQARHIAGDVAGGREDLLLAYDLAANPPQTAGVAIAQAAMLLKSHDYAAARELLDRCSGDIQSLGEHPEVGAFKIAEAIAHSGLREHSTSRAKIVEAVALLETRTEVYALEAGYRWDRNLTGRARRIGAKRKPKPPTTVLTQRQRDVAGLLANGYSYREVARTLAISEKTVGHHAEAIFARLNIRARWQLADALAPHAVR